MMKKLIVLSALLVAGMAQAVGITVQNKSSKTLTVKMFYNNNKNTITKSIAPTKQQDFDTGFHSIDAMSWQEPNNGSTFKLNHKIPGINIGPLLTIYNDGQCDMRDCLGCPNPRMNAAKQ